VVIEVFLDLVRHDRRVFDQRRAEGVDLDSTHETRGKRRQLLQELRPVSHRAVFVQVDETLMEISHPNRGIPGSDRVEHLLGDPTQFDPVLILG